MDWNAYMQGRLSRGHYWLFFTAMLWAGMLIGVFVQFVFPAALNVAGVIYRIVGTALAIAFTISRFHDQDRSGWYTLIPLINLLAPLIDKGTPGPNRFGPEPAQLSENQMRTLKWFAVPAIILHVIFTVVSLFMIAIGQPL